MKNESKQYRNKKVFIALSILIFLLLLVSLYSYTQYKKVSENNNKIKFQLESAVILNLAKEKDNIESLMKIIASDDPSTEKRVPASTYSNLIAADESVEILKYTLDKEPREMNVLLSLHFTFSSLRSFLSQIENYYGFRNQQPFELKNCASGRIETEEDIYNELNKFLEILDYSEKKKLEWKDLVSDWEVDNPYSCFT